VTRRLDEEGERYPVLGQLLGYLNEDWPIDYGTPEKAIDAAIADFPLKMRQRMRSELAGLLSEYEDDHPRLRAVLNKSLHVNVYFKKPAEARAFAEETERKLMESIRGAFAR